MRSYSCFAEYIIFPAGVEGTVKANVKSRTFTPGEAVTWYNAKFLQSNARVTRNLKT